MNILWIVGVTFPEVTRLLGGDITDIKSTGGWILSSANALAEQRELILHIASPHLGINEPTVLKGERINYILLPNDIETQDSSSQKLSWENVVKLVQPDVVHIHGAENTLGLSYINHMGNKNVIMSIQGVMGLIGDYYSKGLGNIDIIRSLTLYDVFRRQSIWNLKSCYKKRGEKERNLYRKLKYIIGRTTIDKAYVWSVSPKTKYFHCNEILRSVFYTGEWSFEGCKKHSIFMSQASYPVKGLHIVIQSLTHILKIYPDLKLRIAGEDFTHPKTIKNKLKFGGYANYIKNQIKKHALESVIEFTGPLNAEEMKKEYLNANVYLLASTIENSPNSLGEAQMLGVPCLASYVGGVPDMIQNQNCGLMYRYDDVMSLTYKVSQLFEESLYFDNSEMIRRAKERHNVNKHVYDTMSIYNQILDDND